METCETRILAYIVRWPTLCSWINERIVIALQRESRPERLVICFCHLQCNDSVASSFPPLRYQCSSGLCSSIYLTETNFVRSILAACCRSTVRKLPSLLTIVCSNYVYIYTHIHTYINTYINTYTGCPRRNVQYFGRVFLMLKYTDITQNTYIQSRTVTEIMAREVW